MLTPWKKNYEQPRQHIKKQRHYFANKGLSSQSYGFSSSQIWMWELDHKEGWAPKNQLWGWRRLESPLDSKEIKSVNPKGNKPWLFIGRADAEAEASILWAPDEKSGHTGKDSDVGTNWRQRRRDRQTMRWLDTITESMDMNLNNFQETVGYRSVCCCYCC